MSTSKKGGRASAPTPPASPPPTPPLPSTMAPTSDEVAQVAGEALDRLRWLYDRREITASPALNYVLIDIRKLMDKREEVARG